MVVIANRRYAKLSENVLMTVHAVQQLFKRANASVSSLEKVSDKLERIRPFIRKQACFNVSRCKLVVERMSRDGERCPLDDEDAYLVVVSVLKPSMVWRGDRSARIRRRLAYA